MNKYSILTNLMTFAFVMLIIIGNTGIWYMPNIESQYAISQSLTQIPFTDTDKHYLMTNYLQPFVFGIFGGKSLTQYMLYTFAVSILFLLIYVIWFLQYHKEVGSFYPYKLLASITFSIFMIPLYWTGMDGMTLLLMLLAIITFRSYWSIFYAFLLGLQHFEQGMAAFLLLLGSFFYSYLFENKRQYPESIRKVIYILLGLLVGKLVLVAGFSYFDIVMLDTRSTYLENHLEYYFNLWTDSWFYILYSLFGVGWLLILKEFRILYPFLFSVTFAFLFLIFVGDQTRVGAIIIFPSLFYWVFMNRKLFENITLKLSTFMLILNFALPVVYVWGGPFFGSFHKYEIDIIHKINDPSYHIDFAAPFKKNNHNWL